MKVISLDPRVKNIRLFAPNSKMLELIKTLNNAADSYYNGKAEVLSDYEWDKLYNELLELENQCGYYYENSPTHNVNKDLISGQKEKHEFPALSLAKTKNIDDLCKWAELKDTINLSWKLDGLTLVVTYDNGKLQTVVTRGDGYIGTNVTAFAKYIKGIPQKINFDSKLIIRGEAVISYSDFNTYNEQTETGYANPRNLASGTFAIKDDWNDVKMRNLQFIPFTLVYIDLNNIEQYSYEINYFNSWHNRMNFLITLGFNIVPNEIINKPYNINLSNAVKEWTNKDYDIPVDGLVICYDDITFSQSGTITGHHATRAGFAYKWQDNTEISTLTNIEWSCGTTKITPVAVFKPVKLEGTIVQRASLVNISECKRLYIGNIGTQVKVIKANKIIPKIIDVIKTEGSLEIPKSCPVCGKPTQIIKSDTGIETLICTNPDCTAKQGRKFSRFVSQDGMNIKGLSEETIMKFVRSGYIHGFSDIYKLLNNDKRNYIQDSIGLTTLDNIWNAIINSKKHVKFNNLLYAMSIPMCGKTVCKSIANYFNNDVYKFIETLDNKDEHILNNIANLDKVGNVKAQSFYKWYYNYNKEFKELVQILDIPKSTSKELKVTENNSNIQGKTFVITGTLLHYKNRKELEDIIISNGGFVTSTVSKNTNMLINNDINSTSSKNKKAKSLNIPIITENEFNKIL